MKMVKAFSSGEEIPNEAKYLYSEWLSEVEEDESEVESLYHYYEVAYEAE